MSYIHYDRRDDWTMIRMPKAVTEKLKVHTEGPQAPYYGLIEMMIDRYPEEASKAAIDYVTQREQAKIDNPDRFERKMPDRDPTETEEKIEGLFDWQKQPSRWLISKDVRLMLFPEDDYPITKFGQELARVCRLRGIFSRMTKDGAQYFLPEYK